MARNIALVDYQIAREGLPPRRGLAYDYVLAGDGLYLIAQNRHLDVRVPVATVPVRGLPPIYPSLTLRAGRLPEEIWHQMVAVARAWSRHDQEVLCTVGYDDTSGYRLALPRQVAGPERVCYRPVAEAVLEIHSHCQYPAHFSPADDADEQRLCLYGVLGRLDGDRPEVALRVGAYGYFLPVPWEAVFAGRRGAFRDAYCDPPEAGSTDDALPH